MSLRVLAVCAVTLLVTRAVLIVALLVRRLDEETARESLRLLPDTIRLVKRVAGDRSLPRGVHVRLWLLLAYLAFPLDLAPDFLPAVGYADDVVIVAAALRSVIRHSGPGAIRRHWPADWGLASLWRVSGLPGKPPPA
jgi:uncharacterized membrane protein YkvA (DUF1232 family)